MYIYIYVSYHHFLSYSYYNVSLYKDACIVTRWLVHNFRWPPTYGQGWDFVIRELDCKMTQLSFFLGGSNESSVYVRVAPLWLLQPIFEMWNFRMRRRHPPLVDHFPNERNPTFFFFHIFLYVGGQSPHFHFSKTPYRFFHFLSHFLAAINHHKPS